MKVKTVVETPDGNYEFSAVLTGEQHDFLVEYAIKDLIQKGLIPFVTPSKESGIDLIAPQINEGNPN